jgi:sugar lactone lactonase YvrE
MNLKSNLLRALLLAAMMLMLVTPAQAYFAPSNGQAATLVLGQPDFTSSASATTQSGMYYPSAVAVDPTTHKVFVSEEINNRVLRFASIYALRNGAKAEAVLGQRNFTSNTADTTQSGMDEPEFVFVDGSGRLWVADYGNNRVLRFDHASTILSGAPANAVLGQPNFSSSGYATTQNGMYYPAGVFLDSSGRLWVADYYNNRVLRFDNAASKANGAKADGVLGQPDFTSNGYATTQSSMNDPWSVAVDGSGRLWVSDESNSRVLRFDNAASKANGAKADGVLGQPDFTSNGYVTSQSGMSYQSGVAVDNSSGRLYVADYYNNRILVFNSAATLANGAKASYVLGQTNFTTRTPGTSATTLDSVYSVFFDQTSKVLFAADYTNSRVLMYGNLIPNGGFNTYLGTSSIPQYWSAKNFSSGDGKNTTSVEEGSASIRISGNGGTKTLSQMVVLQGVAGESFTFSFWVKGNAIPTSAACSASIQFYRESAQTGPGTPLILVYSKHIPCPTGTFAFLQKSATFSVPGRYDEFLVTFSYSAPSGSVWFDDARP